MPFVVTLEFVPVVPASSSWFRVDEDNQYEYKINLLPDMDLMNVPKIQKLYSVFFNA